jgi:anthranilate phosphoribosyltransferase
MLTPLIEKLVRHEDLTMDEATDAMREVMEGRVPSAALAALQAAMRMKGVRPAQLVGDARALREHSVTITRQEGQFFDNSGYGCAQARTVNIS